MITFILFSFVVLVVTLLYTLWGFIFTVMKSPPKLFGFHKLENYQWMYFKTVAAPKWFLRSGVPLAILNWIISAKICGSPSFKEIFATDISLFGKLVLSFDTYFQFFLNLGGTYVTIFFIEFIISVIVLRHKASARPEIEIIPTTGDFSNSTSPKEDNQPKVGQKQITD